MTEVPESDDPGVRDAPDLELWIDESALGELTRPALVELAHRLTQDFAGLTAECRGRSIEQVVPRVAQVFEQHGQVPSTNQVRTLAEMVHRGMPIRFTT